MNCAWCGANSDGSDSHGICDACMLKFFSVNPARVHAQIIAEETEATSANNSNVGQVFPIWQQLHCRATRPLLASPSSL
jgi:hypothetical protein